MKTMVFPIAIYGSESWTINASCRRKIEAFEMTSYRQILRAPRTAYRTGTSILEETVYTREPTTALLNTA